MRRYSLIFTVVFLILPQTLFPESKSPKPKMHNAKIEERIRDDGSKYSVAVHYMFGKKVSEIEFGKDGLYNGKHISWFINGKKAQVGFWKDGYWSGEFIDWDIYGNLRSIRIFEKGKLIKYWKVVKGKKIFVPKDKWPFYVKVEQNRPEGVVINK
jgi:antitoxin component YwqK of YwqJK toxin-antitoxin module